MGRRSRKRGGDALATPATATSPARRRAPSERPRPPWHPFPLVELSVLVGLVLVVLGVLDADEDEGRVMLVCGIALASLGGLETALREHFAGFRSHTTLLAGLAAVLAAGALAVARVPWVVLVAVAA